VILAKTSVFIVHHSVLSLFRQRLYQIIAGYEDANDADRLRHDPTFQILADQPLGAPLGSQPTLSRWENSPSPRQCALCATLLAPDELTRLSRWEKYGSGGIRNEVDETV
jgi:hypothetical protein